MELRKIQDAQVEGKTVLVRVDYNVPLEDGRVLDERRIASSLPTITWLADHGAKIILLSHLGRPEGKVVEELRLDPVAKSLETLLGRPITKLDDCVGDAVIDAVSAMKPADVLLLENVRFHREETTNEPTFTHQLADLADLFVNDAFATMHRAHASTVGISDHLPSYAGILVQAEIQALSPLLESPQHPYVAVVGGKKAQSKLGPLRDLARQVDEIMIGGGVAMTFLHAMGIDVGASTVDHKVLEEVDEIRRIAIQTNTTIHLPIDVVAAAELSPDSEAKVCSVNDIPDGWHAFDIGPQTVQLFLEQIAKAKTIVWTGPMGAYEIASFSTGTRDIAVGVAQSDAYSIIGGGETGEAMERFGLAEGASFVSTGGGACLALLRGKTMPALEALRA
ncbi:phosphoglycerate kinase [Candidatus Bipolaricaulota bacterium]|nr:phosphoglycerate kinase [Candidatus Bipolaricaulota bacterium]TFH10800.1 MAG: phosphoglycerate kinase [Candidatus Atribacteria bacterium]